jgi:hypothetical protein
MSKLISLSILLCASSIICYAQQVNTSRDFRDSVKVKAHASYNNVGITHRLLFGENFRKEWASEVKLPSIDIRILHGGLKPIKSGGGMETKSVRLSDSSGKEWVLRSVEKVPDNILPEGLKGTFAVDWVDDEYSGQHPYSALIIPPLAKAAGIPHANPTIGVLVDNPVLGVFGKEYSGRVVLLEEREPAGKSDNTGNMLQAITKSHDNRFDGEGFLRARLLDLLTGDWDRHEDQWRWAYTKNDSGKNYVAVPRDRDQVLHINQGIFPGIATLPWIQPVLGNFNDTLQRVKYNLYKTRFLLPYPDAQISYVRWMEIVREFVSAESDSVLQSAVAQLPMGLNPDRKAHLLSQLQKRRDQLPRAMSNYYMFINRVVDVRLSDKDEKVSIESLPNGDLSLTIKKADYQGDKAPVINSIIYLAKVTKEIRLYLGSGKDEVKIHNPSSKIKIRIIGSSDKKQLSADTSVNNINVYSQKNKLDLAGTGKFFKLHLSSDTANIQFLPTNHYNTWMPLATAGLNVDDGLLLGAGFRYIGRTGFRKKPYSTLQEVMFAHSFKSEAFRVIYKGEWIDVFGYADFTISAAINAPDNTMNFFGQGNETGINKIGDFRKFYRARFDFYKAVPSLRWNIGKQSTISAGIGFQLYRIDKNDNAGRLLAQNGVIKSYDSTTYTHNKAHIGLEIEYLSDQRNNKILPEKGFLIKSNLKSYAGLNLDSKTYTQLYSELTYYLKIDSAGRLVFSDRIGGGISFGHPAFYQSLFLGGQGNLLGYMQNRFSGKQLFYNNLQARYKLAAIGGYILPGQLGLTGFFDVGRVWIDGEHSSQWHRGSGGGIYFSPASMTVIQVIAGHSSEGWYPYISFNFRL